MTEQKRNNGKELEQLVSNIYSELDPQAVVMLDDRLDGINSGGKRQIDVSIRAMVEGQEILIVIESKDYKRKLDIGDIQQFEGLIRDVGAQKGIMICNGGFTKMARKFAENMKIDICSAHTVSKINWRNDFKIPVVKKSITVNVDVVFEWEPISRQTIDGISIPDVTATLNYFIAMWESGLYSREAGKHSIPINKELLDLANPGLRAVKSQINYDVIEQFHFKQFSPIDYRGIKDHLTESFKPSFLRFREQLPFFNDGTWEKMKNETEVAISSVYINIEMLNFAFAKKTLLKIMMKC